MAVRMVALNQLKNGQFLSRKVIPVDVRDAYARLYRVREKHSSDSPRTHRNTKQRRAMLSGRLKLKRALRRCGLKLAARAGPLQSRP
jgi:hypothetical protein